MGICENTFNTFFKLETFTLKDKASTSLLKRPKQVSVLFCEKRALWHLECELNMHFIVKLCTCHGSDYRTQGSKLNWVVWGGWDEKEKARYCSLNLGLID